MTRLRTWKKVRHNAYQLARWQGNVQPWVETAMLDRKGPKKIVRRIIHRKLGKIFSKQLFGSGVIAKSIKFVLGL